MKEWISHIILVVFLFILYPLLLTVLLGLFGTALATRTTADVTLLRAGAAPYRRLDTGEVAVFAIDVRTRKERQLTFPDGGAHDLGSSWSFGPCRLDAIRTEPPFFGVAAMTAFPSVSRCSAATSDTPVAIDSFKTSRRENPPLTNFDTRSLSDWDKSL